MYIEGGKSGMWSTRQGTSGTISSFGAVSDEEEGDADDAGDVADKEEGCRFAALFELGLLNLTRVWPPKSASSSSPSSGQTFEFRSLVGDGFPLRN